MEDDKMKRPNFLELVKIMSRYYFNYLLLAIYVCFVALAYMTNDRMFIIIGMLSIFLLSYPESVEEICKRCGER